MSYTPSLVLSSKHITHDPYLYIYQRKVTCDPTFLIVQALAEAYLDQCFALNRAVSEQFSLSSACARGDDGHRDWSDWLIEGVKDAGDTSGDCVVQIFLGSITGVISLVFLRRFCSCA